MYFTRLAVVLSKVLYRVQTSYLQKSYFRKKHYIFVNN